MSKEKANIQEWFILSEKGASRGPFSTYEIHQEITKGKLRPKNMIRHKDEAENAWQPLGDNVIFQYSKNRTLMLTNDTYSASPVHFLNLSGNEFKAILHDNLKLREAKVETFDEKNLHLKLPRDHKFKMGNKVYVHLYNYDEQIFVNLWGQVAELSSNEARVQWLEMSPLIEKKYAQLLDQLKLKQQKDAA